MRFNLNPILGVIRKYCITEPAGRVSVTVPIPAVADLARCMIVWGRGGRLPALFAALLAMQGFVGCGPGPEPTPVESSDSGAVSQGATAMTKPLDVEKPDLKFGFIKLTDCAPLVVAKELNYFEDEGLYVSLEAQANWKVLLDRVISGELDGAHMLAGQPIGATIGFGTQASVITAYSLDYNGNGITVSNEIWEQMQQEDPALDSPTPPHPITAAALKPIVERRRAAGEIMRMGMVFPVSTHNYELRYWLAASGIRPGYYLDAGSGAIDITGTTDADVLLSVTPPPQMPATLEARTIDGYCVGEPWNQQAVSRGIGVPVTTNYDIWKNNPEKVFGVALGWAEANPKTHVAVVKALIRAGKWLDATDSNGNLINREEAARMLSRSEYVGADFEVIRNSMTGYFYFQKSDKRSMPDFNVFFKHNASYPFYSDCIWFLTQMRRWGQIPEAKQREWYFEQARKIYRPDIYMAAADLLIEEGYLERNEVPVTDGFKPPTSDFIDGKEYNGREPLEYINSFEIGIKDKQFD